MTFFINLFNKYIHHINGISVQMYNILQFRNPFRRESLKEQSVVKMLVKNIHASLKKAVQL